MLERHLQILFSFGTPIKKKKVAKLEKGDNVLHNSDGESHLI